MIYDAIIVGASFAGLACARRLAQAGRRVLVIERKKEPGQACHTTGIVVKEAAAGLDLPAHLTRPISRVRLYSPSLDHIELTSDDYFFLATDTPAMLRHLAHRAVAAGVEIRLGCAFPGATLLPEGGVTLPQLGLTARYLIGADGPRSAVAKAFGLGQNREFLVGVEAEFASADLPATDAFHCFLNQDFARGYIGWVVPGVEVVQVGLATRSPTTPDIDGFIARIGPMFGLARETIIARRGGLIPIGGVVDPVSAGNVILLGDAAGTVSPLSAGGIHTADHYGNLLAEAIIAHDEGGPHPAAAIARAYPRFRAKHIQRFVFERFAPNWALDLLLTNPLFKLLARLVFFRKKRLKGGQN
ncbi:NAD(P)/FAD-dependent oxidoreductase [Pelagibacterium sp. 26DY04]|uniref:NAD(P)/FAD-dependent oxidoreductase n=1 Tax=Pelagibacterium sp. 26DY04 TaxID=2967130 RepID=UPI002815F993|nr:NAD(P)/FAD-dependent oxidoreductase [Pelagibacterium sp. 26DY04]WMT86581.1 NAD(P)/FAD-dependent oxidoreductase [Pelagibacterium sp. 26DY04]